MRVVAPVLPPAPSPRCRICGANENLRPVTAREMMLGLRHTFTYLECPECGCVQIADIPADLTPYYPPTYYSFQEPIWRTGGRGSVALMLKVCRLLGPTHPLTIRLLKPSRTFAELCEWLAPTHVGFRDRVLDVGAGSGNVLRKLQAFGFKHLSGVDPFITRDIDLGGGTHVFRRSLEQETGSYDLVMAHHSFEHMPNPALALQSMARLLRPDGVVMLRIPVAQSEAWRRFRANWVQLDAPRHLFLHTQKSIEILAKDSGLTLDLVLYDSFAFQFYGSRFYEMDLPLTDERTGRFREPQDHFSEAEMQQFVSESARLNREGRGDQACFYLRRAG